MRVLPSLCALPLALFTGCIGAAPDAQDAVESTSEALTASSWTTVAGVSTRSSPALRSLNGALHMIAVGATGTLRHSTTVTSAAGWTSPVDAGRPSVTALATDTAPALLADGTTLYAFARGANNNLYRASKTGGGAWSAWTALTSHGRVRGRISVAFSRYQVLVNGEPGPSVLVTHALYTGASGTVEYLRHENNTLVASNTFSATEGTLGTNGTTEAFIALRTLQSFTVHRATRSGTGWAWTQVATRSTFGALGRMYDLSDLTFFAGAFHVVFSYRTQVFPDYNTSYRTAHTRFVPGRSDDLFSRTLSTFLPSQDPEAAGVTSVGRLVPEATLAVYRNKLVTAYRMHDGAVRYARWDNADPTAPWIGDTRVASGTSHRRPALAPHDGRPAVSDYASANYGNDLFAAGVDSSAASVRAVDFSRAIFKVDVGAQFGIYNSRSDDPSYEDTELGTCRDQSDPVGPTAVALSGDERPVISEIGFVLWALPSWFSDGLFNAQARTFCQTLPTWPASGRVPTSCSTATRMPVIVRSVDKVFVCRGAWIGRTNNYLRVFEELGHYSTHTLGIDDASAGPTSGDATNSGIALSALQSAHTLFNVGVGRCAGVTGRCQGFTGIANNYDAGSREHSFLYTVYYYMLDGAQLRSWASADALAGNTTLQRKYDWVRDNLFRGVEFNRDLAPRNPL